jgi:hypothetical protein
MTDMIAAPILLYGFRAELKAFYIQKMPKTRESRALFTQRAATF